MVGTSAAYLLSTNPGFEGSESRLDLSTAPGYQLFFSCFMGDLDLSLNGVGFRTNFGWIATLGYAIAFYRTVRELPVNGESTIDFQEDGDWIKLQPIGDLVRVSCSYSSNEQEVSYQDLLTMSLTSLRDLLSSLLVRFPELRDNDSLGKAMTEIGLTFPDH